MNVPPWSSWFLDFDGKFGDAQNAGHVGDVEIYRHCTTQEGVYDIEESWPGWTPPNADWTPPQGWTPPPWWSNTPGLSIYKEDSQCDFDPLAPGFLLCNFSITVSNFGGGIYSGYLNVVENVPMGALFVPPSNGSIAWNCTQPGGDGSVVYCDSSIPVTMMPGTSERLNITLQIAAPVGGIAVTNCAGIQGNGSAMVNPRDCSLGYPPGPDLSTGKTLDFCTYTPGGAICNYWLDVNNLGNVPYTGWLHLVDILPAGAIYLGVNASSDPAWSCIGFGGSVDCWLPTVTLPAFFGNEWVEISIFIPAGTPPGESNCVELGLPEHTADPNINGNNRDCAPVVPPIRGPIILFSKASAKVCPQGWGLQSLKWKTPEGWERKEVQQNGKRYVCGRKKPKVPPTCPEGWQKLRIVQG
jgi:hypothetical protein